MSDPYDDSSKTILSQAIPCFLMMSLILHTMLLCSTHDVLKTASSLAVFCSGFLMFDAIYSTVSDLPIFGTQGIPGSVGRLLHAYNYPWDIKIFLVAASYFHLYLVLEINDPLTWFCMWITVLYGYGDSILFTTIAERLWDISKEIYQKRRRIRNRESGIYPSPNASVKSEKLFRTSHANIALPDESKSQNSGQS